MSSQSGERRLPASRPIRETDWLASDPVFYNERVGSVSRNVNDVIDDGDLDFHAEGLYNYLDFGYSILEHTPVRGIRFMRHSSRLWKLDDGTIESEHLPDPFDDWLDHKLTENEIIELIRDRVRSWERRIDGEIIVPLSGGFDSRLLLWCLEDKTRVRSFTYGTSPQQSSSTEVQRAKMVCERLGVRWQHLQLGEYHNHFDSWYALYGISTHAHGMYQIEFYEKMRELVEGTPSVLSGLVGDIWAGSIPSRDGTVGTEELAALGYTHGLHADPRASGRPSPLRLRHDFVSEAGGRLRDERFRTVTTVRLKIILLSYLLRVPRLFDMAVWTPFVDIDIAMAMVNLPQSRRTDRRWQRDFFAKVGLDLESMDIRADPSNTLNHQAMRKLPLRPLSREVLGPIIDPSYVDWVNRKVRVTVSGELLRRLLAIQKIGGALRRLGFRDHSLAAYCAYLCIWPLERLLVDHSTHSAPQ